jgi:paraquat-inducible protein A
VLIIGRLDAIPRIVALSIAILILMFAATFFPFLHLETGGFSNNASLFDTASAFSKGWLIPLSFAVAALIVIIPVTRVIALLYALFPLVWGRPPARHAAQAFRLAQRLKPWAMAEIFILGVAVALVKVAGLATILPGPAFWAFCALVIITVLKDNMICSWTIWNELTIKRRA